MKIDRLVSIIMILLEKRRIGAQELSDMFEVSKRTIYRDVDVINMAGIPVRSTPGAGGGFEIMQGYKLDRKVFSADDLTAILTGLSSLSGMKRSRELANTLAKVRSFVPADKAREIELKTGQLQVDANPWTGTRNMQGLLKIIQTALKESRLLSFEYADRYGNRTSRTAEPYQLVLKNGQWYLHAYCHERNDFRLFKLARTASLHLQEECFTPREHEKPQLSFTDVLKTMQIRMRIRIHESVRDRVLDHCPPENITPDGTEHYLVDFPFIENDYYYHVLLGFGDRCECLEPLHVRAEMKKRIQNMAALYES